MEHVITAGQEPNKTAKPPSFPSNNWQKAYLDIKDGFKSWRIWLLIAWQDVRLRYRRSQLGPLWITISMAVQIYSIGFLYGKLFHIDLSSYYPHLAGGLLSWAFLSSLINESTTGFISAEGYVKQMRMPYTIFILRVISRDIIVFLHNVWVIVPIIFWFHIDITWSIFLIIPGFLIVLLNAFGFGMIFAMIGARYRDINQVIQSIIQVAFFLTPVMWMADRLPPQYQFTVDYNPFAQIMEIIRGPLIGQTPALYSYLFSLGLGVVGLVLALTIFPLVRKRIIYWL